MSKSDQIQSIKDIKQSEEDDAAKAFADVLEKKAMAEKQLVDLISYRQEYETTLKSSYAKDSAPIEKVQQNRAFINQLSESIYQQQAIIRTLMQELSTRLEQWRNSHASNKGLEGLIELYKQEKNEVRERHAQIESDDVFISRYARDRFV